MDWHTCTHKMYPKYNEITFYSILAPYMYSTQNNSKAQYGALGPLLLHVCSFRMLPNALKSVNIFYSIFS